MLLSINILLECRRLPRYIHLIEYLRDHVVATGTEIRESYKQNQILDKITNSKSKTLE